MIITLKGANFSGAGKNIGTLSTWRISTTLGEGAAYSGPVSVNRDPAEALNATITIADGYELAAAGVTVTMGGVGQAYTMDGSTITISIAEVTGNIEIKVPTTKSLVEEPEEPENPEVTRYEVAYHFVDSNGLTIKDPLITYMAAGTEKWFYTSDAPEIDGYTISSVSPTSATVNEDMTVTYTYTANEAGGDDDNTTIRYALTPKNKVTGMLVNKTTGASEDSSSSRYNEYTVDATWVLYADGYNASKTAKSGGVTYFDAADTYLGYDTLGEDSYGVEFEGELLTVPAGTTTVKVLSSSGKINPALYRETVGTWTEVTKDSTVVGKVTNKETGELEDSSSGRYTSYTVEDSWILCADGYASSKSAAVSYFDASGNYLGYDSLGGLSAEVFEKVVLMVPVGTTTVRVQAALAGQSMALYRLV